MNWEQSIRVEKDAWEIAWLKPQPANQSVRSNLWDKFQPIRGLRYATNRKTHNSELFHEICYAWALHAPTSSLLPILPSTLAISRGGIVEYSTRIGDSIPCQLGRIFYWKSVAYANILLIPCHVTSTLLFLQETIVRYTTLTLTEHYI